MWLSQREYEALIGRAERAEAAALKERDDSLKIVARLEADLASERRERMQDVRHILSMWLRHEKTYPLPPSEAEKVEAKAEAEEAKKRPPILDEIVQAKRKAMYAHKPPDITDEAFEETFNQMLNAGELD